MNFKRIGRVLVCLVLVCCLLVGISPIRAKAIVAEAAVVTGAGVMATLFAISMGLIAVDLTVQLINGMGKSMTEHLEKWGASTGKTDEVSGFLSLVPPKFENPALGIFKIPSDILGGLVDWAKGLINGETIEVEEEIYAPEGYAFFNGFLAPELPSGFLETHPYVFMRNTQAGIQAFFSVSSDFAVIGSSIFANSSFEHLLYSAPNGTNQWSLIATYNSTGSYSFNDGLIWSNFDIYTRYGNNLYLAASEPSSTYYEHTPITLPGIYVGDIPQQVQDGTFDEEKFNLPAINYGHIFDGETDVVTALNNVATQLADQTLTYEEYMELIQTKVDTGTDTAPITGTFADTAIGTFLDSLVDVLTVPFEAMADKIIAGVQAIFVPSTDFLTVKVDALRSNYEFADSIMRTGQALKQGLSGVSTEPPVIYIHLENTEGSYNIGGTVPFLDLRWYAKYKPTVDTLISAFLWICFVWRMLIKLPGIISGMPGDFVMASAHTMGIDEHLPSRSKEYAIQRQITLESIRRGPRK